MSRTRLAPKAPTTKASAPLTPDALEDLLVTVEDRCNRAIDIINATARAVGGDALDLYQDNDVQSLLGASLERIAQDLTALSDRALSTRMTRVRRSAPSTAGASDSARVSGRRHT